MAWMDASAGWMQGSATQWLPVICQGMEGGGSCVTGYVYSGAVTIRVGNDNSLPTLHTPHEAILRLSVRRSSGSSLLLLACLALAGRTASAQSATSLQIDATVLPRHTIGVRGLMSFGRYDALLGDGGTRNIAASFTSDSLGAAQFPQLGYTETQMRTLSGNTALVVKAGRLTAAANSRVLTAPLILEYGLTSKLTLGVVVPLVETRTTLQAQLNPRPGLANVAANPLSPAAWATNAALVTSLRTAATNLQTQLASCQANPSGAGCASLLAQQDAATALIATTTPFATALENLYGTSDTRPGTFFIPVNGTAAQYAIDGQVEALRAQYAQFSQTVSAGNPAGAVAPSANDDLQSLLLATGHDSLASIDRSSIGDITIGATYQLLNTFGDSATDLLPGMRYRVALHAGARIGTGEAYSRNKLFDNATGYGQPGAILGAASDIRFTRRAYLTALGSYTMQFGTIDVARAMNAGNALLPLTLPLATTCSAGNEFALTLIPRYRIAGLFTVDGVYSLKHIDAEKYESDLSLLDPAPNALGGLPSRPSGLAAATGHVLGFGFTYSSSFADRGPGRIPYEASFRHTETISATGGPVAKMFVDQLQLRVFVR